MASSSRSRCSKDSHELSQRYNRILLQDKDSRGAARLSNDRYKVTLVGSAASGVNTSLSDHDFLIEPRNILIDESSLRYRPDLPCYVWIPAEGLAGLVPNVILGDGKYVLANPIRDMCEEIFGETPDADGLSKVGKIMNGPIIKTDLVPQLRISGVPQAARLFSTRERSWPSADIVSLIISGEFHLTARPAPSDPDSDHDFCLSFAKAEVVLLRTLSANQRLCIKLLKGCGPVIDFDRGVLKSYHMKTSALWYFEQTDAQFRGNDLPAMDILKRLDQDLKKGFLPHYFVPEMNLLTGVSEFDLIYLRRRLWSLLGLFIITDDIAGMTPRTRQDLPVSIFEDVSNQLYETNPASTQTVHMSHITNTLEAAEVMYGTGIVSHEMKQGVSASVMTMCPINEVSRRYIDKIEAWLPNKTLGRWMYFRHEDCSYDSFVISMLIIVVSNKDPLEEFFVIKSTGNNKGAHRAIRRALRKSEKLMNKWLAFVHHIITELSQYGNIVADQVLRDTSHKSCGDSRVSRNRREENIDKLINKITKELLTFADEHIETFSYPLDNNDSYLLRPVPVGDYDVYMHILKDVVERIFLNVEYALITSARIKASRGSGDQMGRIMQTMNQESLEYRCHVAWFALIRAMVEFYWLCGDSSELQGWMEFMAATFRREHC